MTDPQVQLSIVATVYCTGGYLAEFCSRSFAAALEAGYDPSCTEVVLVNDGCPRDGLEQALKEREKDGRVRVVDLSRNFGHHLAMYVACEEARGERVFLIDSDLEESPEWLVNFSREMDSTGADVVYGVQEKRKGGLFEAVSGELFYTLFNLLSDQQITRNMVTARLMSARFLREMLKFQDREPFFFGLCVSAGFRQVPGEESILFSNDLHFPQKNGAGGEFRGFLQRQAAGVYFLLWPGGHPGSHAVCCLGGCAPASV